MTDKEYALTCLVPLRDYHLLQDGMTDRVEELNKQIELAVRKEEMIQSRERFIQRVLAHQQFYNRIKDQDDDDYQMDVDSKLSDARLLNNFND